MGSPESNRLFAEKGSARPVGLVHQPVQGLLGTIESQLQPDGGSGPDQTPFAVEPANAQPDLLGENPSDQPDVAEPASLLTIDLRRPRSPGLTLAPTPEPQAAPDASQDNEPANGPDEERIPAALVSPPEVQDEPEGENRMTQALLAGLAVICLAGGLWYVFDRSSAEPTIAQAPPVEAAQDAPNATEPTTTEAAPESAAVGEPVPAAVEPPASEPAPQAAVAPAAPEVAPSFDLVRIEPDGQAVLAGRAEPHAELILLDNGAPLGTVSADAAGEWAFVPDAPLSAGDHNFSLVLNTPQGTITVLEKAKAQVPPAKPAVVPTPDATQAPVPTRKPQVADTPEESAAAAPRGYAVQLISVSSQADADAAWATMRQAYPALLGDMTAKVEQAALDDQTTRYRVIAGAFGTEAQAEALCRSLNAQQQDCIVVRR